MKNPFRSIRVFAGETIVELKKASWPTLSELRDSTLVVIVAIAIFGVFIAAADFSLVNLVQLFNGWVK